MKSRNWAARAGQLWGLPTVCFLAPGSVARARRRRSTTYARNFKGTTMYLREHHFPKVYAGEVHLAPAKALAQTQFALHCACVDSPRAGFGVSD
jgi:hypothetical protein